MSTPILGRGGPENRNPLLVLADAANALLKPLEQIANNTRPDATAVLPHVYAFVGVTDEHQGKMWGSVCLACTDTYGSYVYPCAISDEPVKPPRFFTVGDVFDPDSAGRMRRVNGPTGS